MKFSSAWGVLPFARRRLPSRRRKGAAGLTRHPFRDFSLLIGYGSKFVTRNRTAGFRPFTRASWVPILDPHPTEFFMGHKHPQLALSGKMWASRDIKHDARRQLAMKSATSRGPRVLRYHHLKQTFGASCKTFLVLQMPKLTDASCLPAGRGTRPFLLRFVGYET